MNNPEPAGKVGPTIATLPKTIVDPSGKPIESAPPEGEFMPNSATIPSVLFDFILLVGSAGEQIGNRQRPLDLAKDAVKRLQSAMQRKNVEDGIGATILLGAAAYLSYLGLTPHYQEDANVASTEAVAEDPVGTVPEGSDAMADPTRDRNAVEADDPLRPHGSRP